MLTAFLALAVAAAPYQKLPLDGFALAYRVEGRGPPLLLVHGGGGDGSRFDTLVPRLKQQFTVIRPDCRGRGRSTDAEGPITYEAMAKDLLALLDHLKLQRAHVVGWSDGGIIALHLAMTAPERVDRIVAFGANARPDGLTAQAKAFNESITAESWKNPDYERVTPTPGHWPVVALKLKQMWSALPDYSNEQLKRIKAPTLIAAGDHDDIKLEHTVSLFQTIPNAQLLILPGAGHSFLKQPLDQVEAALTRFLRSGESP